MYIRNHHLQNREYYWLKTRISLYSEWCTFSKFVVKNALLKFFFKFFFAIRRFFYLLYLILHFWSPYFFLICLRRIRSFMVYIKSHSIYLIRIVLVTFVTTHSPRVPVRALVNFPKIEVVCEPGKRVGYLLHLVSNL